MKIFKSASRRLRSSVQVIRMMAFSIRRKIWRSLNCARLVAITGTAGHKIRLGANVNVQNPGSIRCGSGVTIGDNAELLVEPTSSHPTVSIEIGNNAKIGKRCQLAANPGQIRIGDHVSLHSNVVLLGHVNIGRYTLLSANIFASSGNHRAFDYPHLLIRDQDHAAFADGREIKPVVIEEDCWIGWGAAIMSGIHIGRGAVVGANAVVTRDVEPYEVVAGQPARSLKKRLSFSPITEIVAAQFECGPYLYRGFLQSKLERQVIAMQWADHVGALSYTTIVLSGKSGFSYLKLRGVTLAQNLLLHILLDGCGYLLTLPKKAGVNFEYKIPLCELQSVDSDLGQIECRVSDSRLFHLIAKFTCPHVEYYSLTPPALWAIHSASLI